MNRLLRLPLIALTAVGAALIIGACGTNRINVPKADASYHADLAAAHLFNERCGGCHTLSYGGSHGSGVNPRTYESINGPNFDVRCERPVARVLYAIENGGFSGAYMPQNVVVGQQAREVAMFVAKFSGRHAPPGGKSCKDEPIGTLPALPSAASGS